MNHLEYLMWLSGENASNLNLENTVVLVLCVVFILSAFGSFVSHRRHKPFYQVATFGGIAILYGYVLVVAANL